MRRYILLIVAVALVLPTAGCGTFGLVSVMNEPLSVSSEPSVRWGTRNYNELALWRDRVQAELDEIESDPSSTVSNYDRARYFVMLAQFDTDYFLYDCDRFED